MHFTGNTVQLGKAVFSCQWPDKKQTSLLSNLSTLWQVESISRILQYAIFYETSL